MRLGPILFFIFILFYPSVTAEEMEEIDMSDFLDMFFSKEWNEDFNSLNYKATCPEVVWSADSKLSAWVDIVGYKNMSRINNTDYIYGDPVDCVIVEYEVKDLLQWNDNVDWIREDISYSLFDDNITVILDITMLWHHSTLKHTKTGKSYIKKDYSYAFMTINDIEKVPLQYNFSPTHIPTYLIFYNNTFSPKTIINVPEKEGLFYVEYSYNNETIKQNLMNAEIEKNPKGIEFINFTFVKNWNSPDNNLSHIGDSCIITGANFTAKNLNITLRTPYKTFDVTNYNVTINNVSASSCMSSSLIPFCFIITLLLFTLLTIVKVVWR